MGCSEDLSTCPPGALATAESAYARGNLATGFVISGALLLGGGVILWLVAPEPESSPGRSVGATAVRLTPSLGPDQAGLSLRGGF